MNRRNRSLARPLLLVAVALGLMTMLTSLVISNQNYSGNSLLPASLSVHTANAQVASTSTKSFVIMISSKGFDDNGTIAVNQGDTVSITFIMDQTERSDTNPLNHHVITIDGYNIQSADINPTHPNATVTFTASQLGTFSIYCDTPDCPIHALMVSATMEVDPAAPSSSTTSTTTTSTTQSTSTQTTSTSSTTSSTTSSRSSSASTSTSTTTSTLSTTPEFPAFVVPVIFAASLVTALLLLGVARRHRQL